MKNNLEYVYENGLINNSKLKDNIYNKMKSEDKIKEEIKVENIPLCIECILEDEEGVFICGDCKINLCPQHAMEHLIKCENHKFLFLFKN